MTLRLDKRVRRAWATIATAYLAKAQAAIHEWGFGEPVWVSADGKVSTYSELDDRHLRNIIALLRREGETDTKKFRELAAEQRRRRLSGRY